MKKILAATPLLTIVVWLLLSLSFLREFDKRLYDWKIRLLSRPLPAPFVFVEIDQASLDFYREKFSVGWPWPREFYGKAVKFMHAAGARAVFLDLLFSEPSVYGDDDDQALAAAMRSAGNVLLPFFFQNSGQACLAIERFALRLGSFKQVQQRDKVVLPIPALLAAAATAGNANQSPDPDGIFRSLRHLTMCHNRLYPSLSLALALWLQHLRWAEIPWRADGSLPVKFYRSANSPRYSIMEIIQSQVRKEEGNQPTVDPNQFHGQIVFVGATAAALRDLRPTPLDPLAPGYVTHAFSLANFLYRDYLRPVPGWLSWLIVFLLILFLFLALLRCHSYLTQILLSLAGVGLVTGMDIFLFSHNLNFPLLPPMLGIMLTSAFVIYYRYHTVGKEKKFLKNAFRYYMSDSLLNEIVKNPAALALGGKRKTLTVFFSDLQGFTSLSERLEPEDVVGLLNRYLERMTNIVLAGGGYLNKYEGDAIMAFWGAPYPSPEHAANAIAAAFACLKELRSLNEEFDCEGLPHLVMRIGLNTGEVIAGNIGSMQRFEYTVIGDAVNLASRLEGINKQYGTSIICGPETRRLAAEKFLFRQLDRVRVKGKTRPVEIFEPLGGLEDVPAERRLEAERFSEGLADYFRGDFAAALSLFEQLPGDAPARVFSKRCRLLLTQPPAEWDGISNFAEK